jgi:aryl-alcohol dehydrogenase-like predicted oxidoreductase
VNQPAAIPIRHLGSNGLETSALGLCCYNLSTRSDLDDDAACAVIRHAIDNGVRLLDTAADYGGGRSEELIGAVLSGATDADVSVATKFGLARGDGGLVLDGRPQHARRALEGSLRRLGRDHVELYFLHRVDPDVPIEDTVGAMAEFVAEGKVGALGLCEVSGDTLRRACAVHPIAAVQSEYSVWWRDPEATLLPAARALGTTLVAFSPLGRGFLTGTVTTPDDLPAGDYRRAFPRFSHQHLSNNRPIIETLGRVAAAHDCTTAEVALAWVLARGDDVIAIPGSSSLRHVDANIRAAGLELSVHEMEELDDHLPPATGDRYPPDLFAKTPSS